MTSAEIQNRLTQLDAELATAKTELATATATGTVKPYVERKARVELLEAEGVALRAEHPFSVQRELDTAEVAADAAAKQAREALIKRRAEVAAQLVELFDPKITGQHFQPAARSCFDAIVASERSCDALYTALRIAENAADTAARKAWLHHDQEIGRGLIRRARVC
jgi:hypothetical protein